MSRRIRPLSSNSFTSATTKKEMDDHDIARVVRAYGAAGNSQTGSFSSGDKQTDGSAAVLGACSQTLLGRAGQNGAAIMCQITRSQPLADAASRTRGTGCSPSRPVRHSRNVTSKFATARYAIQGACSNRHGRSRIWPCVRVAATGHAAMGRELKMPQLVDRTAGPVRTAVVVGGGPAGLEAARVLGERGHDVDFSTEGGWRYRLARQRNRTSRCGHPHEYFR